MSSLRQFIYFVTVNFSSVIRDVCQSASSSITRAPFHLSHFFPVSQCLTRNNNNLHVRIKSLSKFVSNKNRSKSGAQNYQKCLNVAINGLRVKFDDRKPLRERLNRYHFMASWMLNNLLTHMHDLYVN